MAYGNNRAAQQSRASFQVAGGCIMKFRHPLLAGSIDTGIGGVAVDEIDVSRCVKLADTFFSATPNQDASKQEVLVDGSTVAITNHLLNGTIRMPVLSTTGTVAKGDFIEALHLIRASKDAYGGTFTITEFIDGLAHTTLYYGISIKSVPDKIKMGMDLPVYNVELYYAGWIKAVSQSASINLRQIWAVGSQNGIEGIFRPYEVNTQASTGTAPMSQSNALGQGVAVEDDLTAGTNQPTADGADELVNTAYPYIVGTPTQLP